MPGIVGYVDFEDERVTILDDMLSTITYSDKHRIEKYEKPPLWIGRSDLTTFNPEQQPVVDKDGSTIVFFQGNIVNKEEIEPSASNSELVLLLFKEFGTDFVHKVKGQFTAAIWDSERERLIIANDRFGRYPLYYTRIDKNQVVFGSEVKAILLHPAISKEINDQAIIDFIMVYYLWGDQTFFKNIRLLPYASVLEFGKDYFNIKRYWEYQFVENHVHQNVERYRDKLHELLKQTLRRAVGDCKNIGITLSGGLDTRVIAAYAPGDRTIHSFTFGVPGCYDVKYAKRLSEILGFKHHFVPLTSEYIPKFSERVIYASDGSLYILAGQELLFEELERELGIELKVVGSSSSTLFGGFLEPALVDGTYTSEEELYDYFFDLQSLFSEAELKDLLCAEYYERVKDLVGKSFKEALERAKKLHRLPANIIDHINFTERSRRRLSISGPMLSRLTTETINIFDYDLIDFMLTVPPELRLGRKLYIETFKYYYPELSRIPWQGTGLSLYSGEFRKKISTVLRLVGITKKRLVERVTRGGKTVKLPWDVGDYAHYLREQREFVEGILLDERILSRGVFNPGYIKKILGEYLSGKKHARRSAMKIAVLISIELWFRKFVDS